MACGDGRWCRRHRRRSHHRCRSRLATHSRRVRPSCTLATTQLAARQTMTLHRWTATSSCSFKIWCVNVLRKTGHWVERSSATPAAKQQPTFLKVGEWVVFRLFSSSEEMLVVGKVKTIGVYPQSALQADHFQPPDRLSSWTLPFIGAFHYHIIFLVKWSPAASSMQRVHRNALVAVGFSMQALEAKPLSWEASCTAPTFWTAASWASICDECVCASSIEPSWADHRDGPEA